MLIVGEKEVGSKSVSIRRRHKGDLGMYNIEEVVDDICNEIKDKRRFSHK